MQNKIFRTFTKISTQKMNQSSVLTAQQQNQTLSAKKNKKKSKKLSLLSPNPFNYKPIITQIECQQLVQLLENIPKLVEPSKPVPWSTLKFLTKVERKRLKLVPTDSVDSSLRQALVFGINSIANRLENDKLSCVLITEDVKPFFMVEHIIKMCVRLTVPVLIVGNLRSQLKTITGIGSSTLGICRDTTGIILQSIVTFVKKLSADYMNKNNIKGGIIDITDDTIFETGSDCDQQLQAEVSKNKTYVFRSSKDERAFVPAVAKQPNLASGSFDGGYISFIDNLNAHRSGNYKKLKVVSLEKDNNRKSRKRKRKQNVIEVS